MRAHIDLATYHGCIVSGRFHRLHVDGMPGIAGTRKPSGQSACTRRVIREQPRLASRRGRDPSARQSVRAPVVERRYDIRSSSP